MAQVNRMDESFVLGPKTLRNMGNTGKGSADVGDLRGHRRSTQS